MSCLGVLFSLDNETVTKIASHKTDEERLEYLQEQIEEVYFDQHPEWVAELDKSWDALHRCLTDGNLEWDNGLYPLNHVVLGGKRLYQGQDYIITLKTPEQVNDISKAIELVTKEGLRSSYFKIDEKKYDMELSEDDFEYTWDWFFQTSNFWKLAAEQNRNVLFTVDQ